MKPSTKARLIPVGSAGTGLGQETGGNQRTDAEEARKLITMIIPGSSWPGLTENDRIFIEDMNGKVKGIGTGLIVSGRQLLRLRDLKDKLVEAGAI